MKIQIGRINDQIICNKDYRDIDGKGEISHFLAEIEIIKMDLLELWEEYSYNEK